MFENASGDRNGVWGSKGGSEGSEKESGGYVLNLIVLEKKILFVFTWTIHLCV